MANLAHLKSLDDKRDFVERRKFTWRTVFYGFVRSRRRNSRRSGESEPIYTDWHHPWLFFLATGTMLLSCMDAFFTLQLIDRGAIEINPVMAVMIGQGTLAFAVIKMLLTGLGILALVYMSRFRMFNLMRTGLVLTVAFSAYASLVCYEFVYLLQTI